MKRFAIPLTAVMCINLCSSVRAADPTWWAARGVTTSSSQSNLSPATIGQAKHMVAMALAELQPPRLHAPVTQALQANIATLVDLAAPTTPAAFETQRAVLLVGQLKAISAPLYLRLHNSYRPWLETQLTLNQTKDPNDAANFYPWSSSPADDSNKAVATIGQLKAVFALRFETLPSTPLYEDNDGMSDSWELAHGLDPTNPGDAANDADSDGLLNLAEFLRGTDPSDSDTDNDFLPDGWEVYYNLDPTSDLGVNGAIGNPDGDGFLNLSEYVFGFNPQVASPAISVDTDADGHDDNVDYFPLDPLLWQAPAGSNIAGVPVITLLSPPGAVLAP